MRSRTKNRLEAMPGDYKYEHISAGRMKALKKAESELYSLYRDMAESNMIAPSVIDRLKVIRTLVHRAASGPLDNDEIALLEGMFGKDLGTEKQ